MRILNRLAGNASRVDNHLVKDLLEELLVSGEHTQITYRLIRDFVVFTNKRLILIDIQGVSGKKKSIESIPYTSISRFSIETAGTVDLDSELDIYISASTEPTVSIDFGKQDGNIYEIARTLAEAIFQVN